MKPLAGYKAGLLRRLDCAGRPAFLPQRANMLLYNEMLENWNSIKETGNFNKINPLV